MRPGGQRLPGRLALSADAGTGKLKYNHRHGTKKQANRTIGPMHGVTGILPILAASFYNHKSKNCFLD
jgi:hypothetical protein